MPSSTHSGSVLPFSVTVLRILILLAAPGPPEVGVDTRPATLATPSRAMSDILTEEIDEVSLRFSMRWYPVTTTASTLLSDAER